jgi:hypothetical protein
LGWNFALLLARLGFPVLGDVYYETFRNLIVNSMRVEGYQPPKMKKIIEYVLLK